MVAHTLARVKPRTLLSLGMGLLVTVSGGCVRSMETRETRALQNRSVTVLREAMQNQSAWLKVHAAEALVWNGHLEGVRETFLAEVPGAEPKYRIGVWRVLAQAVDGPEREAYIARIRGAFEDADGPDRLHAVETLAKLGESQRSDELERVAADGEGSMRAYARWVLANSGAASDEASLAELLDTDGAMRGTVGYALRFFPSVRPGTLAKLEQTARDQPVDSPARVYLLSAWCVHASPAEKPAVKRLLLGYLEDGEVGQKFETCMALARCGKTSDLPLLTRLLADPEPDVRIGAAHAILRIAAR